MSARGVRDRRVQIAACAGSAARALLVVRDTPPPPPCGAKLKSEVFLESSEFVQCFESQRGSVRRNSNVNSLASIDSSLYIDSSIHDSGLESASCSGDATGLTVPPRVGPWLRAPETVP